MTKKNITLPTILGNVLKILKNMMKLAISTTKVNRKKDSLEENSVLIF